MRFVCVAGLVVTLGGCAGLTGHAKGPAPEILAPPTVSSGGPSAWTLLGDVPERAAGLGAGPASLVTASLLVDDGWTGGFVNVPPDQCVLAYARGATSIDDVDIAIYSDDGAALAVDEGRDVHPTVVLCPPHPNRVYVAAHVVDGEGFVAAAAQLVARDKADGVASGLGARGTVSQGSRPADAWPGLDDAVRAHRVSLGGRWDEFKRIALSVDARLPSYAAMEFGPDQCLDAIAVPDDEVGLLDLEVVDDKGRVLARADGAPDLGARTLTVCSPIATNGALVIRPHVGRGLAAIVLARADRLALGDVAAHSDVAWMASTRSLADAEKALDSLLAERGYPGPSARTVGVLNVGRRVSVPLQLRAQAGGCHRIDVVAGAPLGFVRASAWGGPSGSALLASGESSSSQALFVCAGGSVRLDLDARGRSGPFAVIARPERWVTAAFAASPLATSRLFHLASVGSDALVEDTKEPFRRVALASSSLTSWSETVPARACLRVVAGVEGDGAGVDLRAIDGAGEMDRQEGAEAAAVRACAPADRGDTVRIEMRASAGRLDAVVGEWVR